ncbi:MAG: TIGR04190 family B12-binding domain/radical SAM domain protein [Methanomassiliicoccales archaeon]|nr:TIGR04190 family B12-binding domain/radical SAM domain protein [Methanomassiliicoccales archaeon]
MSKEDIIFLHAPSVYDFRKEFLFYGPVSDMVPSTPVFEMYPFGFITMAVHQAKNGYKVRIVNLASMMLNDRKLDVEKLISKLDSKVFGIDLHWLPHAHGALEIAKLVKKHHPKAKVLMGGFSATYYHEELLDRPEVDLILKGDSTEVPLQHLMEALKSGTPLEQVENLSWKDEKGVHHNPISYVPDTLDYQDVDYGWIVRSVIRHHDIEGHKPFKDWDRYPITMVFSIKGCHLNCSVCGGSCSAMHRFLNRKKPAFRDPEKLAMDVRNIQNYIKAPTFIVGDPRRGGPQYMERFFAEVKRLKVTNPLVFEFFTPPDEEFYKLASTHTKGFSVEISPDSHDPEVREALGRKYSNEELDESIRNALKYGAERFDVFFMIGLPKQTRESAVKSAEYAKHLYEVANKDPRLCVFISPLAPFLDPGSMVFEDPEKYGYISLARTLEEHRARLPSPSWKYVLSYETKWMTRDDIAEVSYEAADAINKARFDCGLITKEELDYRLQRSSEAAEMMKKVDAAVAMQDPEEKKKAFQELQRRSEELMESTITHKREMEWMSKSLVRSMPRAVISLIRGL